jgi:hypothetical protein
MKLFERSGAHWLFWWSFVYFIVGMLGLFVFKVDFFPLTQILWLSIIALPLTYNPLARWLNMKENTMFDWFKSREERKAEYNNVVPFPEVPKTPYIVPPTPKKEAETYYSIGITDDNRMSLKMGYSTLTMNREGCQNLIDQLTVFMNQLPGDDDGQSD